MSELYVINNFLLMKGYDAFMEHNDLKIEGNTLYSGDEVLAKIVGDTLKVNLSSKAPRLSSHRDILVQLSRVIKYDVRYLAKL